MSRAKNFIPGPEALAQFAREHTYFTVTTTGIELLDPVTSATIRPDTPPAVLYSDPVIGAGLEYISQDRQSHDTSLTLILGPHRSARDFTSLVGASAELLAEAPLVAINALSNRAEQPYRAESIRAPQNTLGSFQLAERNWLRDNSKRILPCEYPAGPVNNHLRATLKALAQDSYQAADFDPSICGYEAPTMLANALHLAHNTLREWTLIGRLGSLLLQEHQATTSTATNLPYIIDWKYRAMADKFKGLGMAVDVHEAAEHSHQTAAEYLRRVVQIDTHRQAKASFTQLKMPL